MRVSEWSSSWDVLSGEIGPHLLNHVSPSPHGLLAHWGGREESGSEEALEIRRPNSRSNIRKKSQAGALIMIQGGAAEKFLWDVNEEE